MTAITSTGLGSGLDIEGLVSKLVSSEGQPASTRLNRKEAQLQATVSALGSFKGALSAFQSNVQGLKNLSAFQARTATSSNSDLFAVSADNSAVAGSFSIKVDQLAQSAKMHSGNFTADTAILGAGTLAISLGASSFNITTDGTTTLAGVRDAINKATDNPGIKATIIKVDSGSQLILTSDKVGAANTISIGATDADALDGNDLTRLATASLTSIQTATDAVIYVDGQKATRDSNSFSDVISGVTLTLKKADPLTTGSVNIALDKDSVKSKVNDFIKAYNSLAGTMSNLSSYNATTKQASLLFGDATLRGVQGQLRQVLSNPVQGASVASTLAEIGIKTNKSGVLELDSTKLDKVIASNFESVSQLFASSDGLAVRFDNVLTSYLSSNGALPSRVDGINKQISGISEQRAKLNTRLTALDARYRKQFTAMDALVGQLQATGSYLTQQLDNLPGFVSK
jgi:flagellar hook-associated protein 2